MMHVGIIGGGIGGLAAAVGLQRVGATVTVLERAVDPRTEGSALSLFGNGFTALNVLGLEAQVRDLIGDVADLQTGQRSPDGRWLSRTPPHAVSRLGVVHRAELSRVFRDALPPGTVRYGVEALAVSTDGSYVTTRPSSIAGHEVIEHFDLVIGADGIRSRVRATFSDDPGPRYAGYSAWRGVTSEPVDLQGAAGETWGRRLRFGMAPLKDGRVYWFAVASMPAGTVLTDEHDTVKQLFATWHAPISRVIAATDPQAVFRLDIHDLAAPLASFRRGRCLLLGDAAHAMTPDLGQGGGQALEDAATLTQLLRPVASTKALEAATLNQALNTYDLLRRRRTQPLALRARRVGAIAHTPSATGQRLRDIAMRWTPDSLMARELLSIQAWEPPTLSSATRADGRM